MADATIETLIEQLSCDFVLADINEPESLAGLLPILKQIHRKCLERPDKDKAKEVLKAKIIIKSILKTDPGHADRKISELGDLISRLSSSQYELRETHQIQGDEEGRPPGKTPDTFDPDRVGQTLETLSGLLRRFCPGEISDLGSMLNVLDPLVIFSKELMFSPFCQISIALRGYVEKMILEQVDSTKPLEEGLVLLKSILSHLKKGDAFEFDYADVLQLLNMNPMEAQHPGEHLAEDEKPEPEPKKNPEKISADDMEILTDFVSEAHENLETIEVNLIGLEQDPSNKEIINEIFRPFHTIKGVSGFLSLIKINTLAHTTENLLDSARSGDFLIDCTATDAILESVDTLKKLLSRVKQGVDAGFLLPDDDIDVDDLREKLKTLQISLIKKERQPLGEILFQKGDISMDSLKQALEIQKNHPEKKIGEILVEEKTAGPRQVASALMDQQVSKGRVAAQVKVSTEKLDDLVDYAGELVIAQSMLRQKLSGDPSLSQSVAQLGQIVTHMQNIAMSMRMVPIKATFMKMIRLVRDLSLKSGKTVALIMEGQDTEIDRNVVEALYEPMVHMIRNSVDHGIEAGPDRLDQDKPSQGTIVLRAYHKGGNIIIEIEDDGKGLDKVRILEKAKETGLITGSEQLTDAQIYDLILQPGFSTAKEITDVSGRGVGMDVVKEGIEKFRGQLSIASSRGVGTKFTISLPLTLAIIDGMLVGVDDEKYVIPTTAIQKAFKPGRKDYFTVRGKGEMIKDRGSLIPIIRLNEIFNNTRREKFIENSLVVVVESKDEKRALLIDELLGKGEYVIKSLGANLEDIKGLAGGAILADGRVGLILDIHGIFSLVSKEQGIRS